MRITRRQVFGLVFLSVCLPFFSNQAVFAAENSKVTGKLDAKYLRDYAETRGFMLGRPVKAKPSPDGKSVLFLRAQARVAKQSLYIFDVETGKTSELLTPEQVLKGAEEHLSAEEKARRERQRISVGGFTDFQLSDDSKLILVSLSGKLYIVNRASGKITELQTGKKDVLDPKFSPDSKKISYVQNFDLHYIDLDSGKSHQITTGGSAVSSHGLAEFVAQEEMDRFSGYWWSPDSKSIAYEQSDASGVEVWYLSDPQHPEQAPVANYYPRPGKANVIPKLGIVSINGGKTRWVDWDAKAFPYMGNLAWTEDGPLSMVVLDREQQNLKLLEINPETGSSKILLSYG
jgi:dipeptidyl-peptidase-4